MANKKCNDHFDIGRSERAIQDLRAFINHIRLYSFPKSFGTEAEVNEARKFLEEISNDLRPIRDKIENFIYGDVETQKK